ncbi:MAG: tetratricopeptide repeat protein, partial [Thermoplasmata archaeon]
AQERFRNLVVRYEDLYALFNLAYIFVEKKEYEKAFDLVDSSIKDAPVKLLAAYATMAARAGDRNRSEAIAKEIMRRPTPKDHLVAVSLATALSMVEETIPQAIIQLKNLLAEKPDYVPALIALARIYARTDALKAAYEYLKKALVISPHNFKALMLHAELELIRGTGSISSSHLKKDHLDEPSSESRSDTSSTTISNTAGVRFKDSEAEIEKHVSISALNNVIELAGKALISRPESVEPLLLQLKALRILGNYDKAKEIVVKLEAKELPNGMMFEVLKEWAHVLMDRKEFAAAKDIIEKALNIKEDYELKNLLKTAYFELGYEGKAVDIISKDGKASSSNDILLLARALVSEGKIEDAIRKLEEMLLYEPANADAAYQAARLYILTGRQPDARTLLEKALTLNPGDVRLLNELGLILLDLGDIDSAEAKFRLAAEKAAEKRGENGERLTNYYYPEFNLGLCAYKRGNKKTGIQMMEQAVRRSRMPDAAVANTLSLIYEEEGDIKSALMWLEISIEENLLQRIEKALSHDKDFSGYRESLQAFLDDPSLKQEFSKFWFRASILQNRLELYDEALSSADESLRGDPHNVPCWIERARAQLGLGRNKEALQTIRYARAIKPDSQYLLAMEAAVLKKLGDYEGAARIYRKLWM